MMFIDAMYRSFAALRMTMKRNRVILSEAKDLYEWQKTTMDIRCSPCIDDM